MGKASSSSSASAGIQSRGGDIIDNEPNMWPWIAGIVLVVIGAVVWFKTRRGR